MHLALARIRRLVFWSHLAMGLVIGLWIAFLAATGILIAFEQEIVGYAERRYQIEVPLREECVLPSELVSQAEARSGKAIFSLVLYRDIHRPAEAIFERRNAWLLDPCSGAVLTTNSGSWRPFFHAVTELHYAVTLQGRPHPVLRRLKNFAVVVFVFLIFSGLWLWIPRSLRWKSFRAVLLIRRGAQGRARNWNLHHVAGIWAAVPLLAITATGLVLAYPSAAGLLYRMNGEPVPSAKKSERTVEREPRSEVYAEVDRAIFSASSRDDVWQRLELRLPVDPGASMAVTLLDGASGDPRQRIRMQYSTKSHSLTNIEHFKQAPKGKQWLYYARFLHTGEMFGWLGKSIAAIAAFAALVLVWTGFRMSLWRWRASCR